MNAVDSTSRTLAVPMSSWTPDTLSEALGVMRRAHLRDGPPSAAVRRDRLDRLIGLLSDNAQEFSEALRLDFGSRPQAVSYFAEFAGILPDILLTRARLKSWMRPARPLRPSALIGASSVVEPTPLGVVGVIGPWNFPICLTAQPTASALAAGNRVMIKFSEITPLTAEAFAARAKEYFRPEELQVVTGGPEVGADFSHLPLDHLFFTGSPGVGALVAQAAAANLVPTTLELGGKNPAVVAERADLSKAARRIISARMVNGGQLCLCPDYAFVPRAGVEEFVQTALDSVRTTFPQVAANPDLVSLVNQRNFDRVTALIEDAIAKGATVHQAAPSGETLPDATTRKIAPTLLAGVTDDMAIANDEVFGPVLTVFGYDDIDDVVRYVAERPPPLAAYWYGPKDTDFDTFRRGTTSGGITVNDFALHCAMPGVPFGGVGRSGWGAYHGKAGFDTFSHQRTVTTSHLPLSMASFLMPPFSSRTSGLVESFVRRAGRRAARRRLRGRPRRDHPGRTR